MIGVEPTCLAALDPKSSASANFATSAFPYKQGRKNRGFDGIPKSFNKHFYRIYLPITGNC